MTDIGLMPLFIVSGEQPTGGDEADPTETQEDTVPDEQQPDTETPDDPAELQPDEGELVDAAELLPVTNIEEILPHDIFFVTTEELAEIFPDNTPKEREYYIAKAKGAVCIMQIGDKLENGKPHDGRAPDYDDWALNADIIVYYPVLDIALELSSMGIRVDKDALLSQLEKAGCPERAELPFQKSIINEELPYTIGGGIGQSRICMFFLRKAHIGEVQSSIWPDEMVKECEAKGIQLL